MIGLFRRGCLLAALLALAALAAIALLVMRPARVVGVSGDPLAASLDGELQAGHEGECEEIEGGRAEGTVWRCALSVTEGRNGPQAAREFTLEVSEWGCWRAQEPASEAGRRLEDCIWLADYVDIFD